MSARSHAGQTVNLDQRRGLPDRSWNDLAPVWGSNVPIGRAPRLLGIFAHPDDEIFCAGGTVARCAEAGAETALVSLTRGEAGQICDAAAATRRTLGAVRAKELGRAADALGVHHVTCLDLGDGQLELHPLEDVSATVRNVIDEFRPDVIITFGPDGAFGHPDHITSCLATMEAAGSMIDPPRLLHAAFPREDRLLVDLLVEWLTSKDHRFTGTAAFGHALKLFADGSSMLGFAADHLDVEWFPAGSYIIEQGEPARSLYCILSGSVDIVIEGEDGAMHKRDTAVAGSFVGEDGLASGRPRNAHVIAREDVTCLVLAPEAPTRTAPRGRSAPVAPNPMRGPTARDSTSSDRSFSIDVRSILDRKVAALAAHRSQYALDSSLLPRPLLETLLGTEHFTVADIPVGRR